MILVRRLLPVALASLLLCSSAEAALVAYWRMEEGSGLVTYDEIRAVDDTFVGDTTWSASGAPAPQGSTASIAFDGAGDYIQTVGGFKGVTGTNPRTLSAWIQTSSNDDQDILSWGSDSGGQKWVFRVQNDSGKVGAIRVEVNGGYVVGHQAVGNGAWHHVAATWENDGTPDVSDVKLYVDGIPQSLTAIDTQSRNTASSADVRIGSEPWNTGRPFTGLLDEVRIYNEVLSAADIRVLATGSPDIPPGMLCDASVSSGLGVWPDLVVTNQTSSGSLDLNLSGVTHTTAPNTHFQGIDGAYVFSGGDTAALSTSNMESAYSGNPTDASASVEVLFRPADLLDNDVIWEFGGATDGASLTLQGDVLQFIAKDGSANGAIAYDLDANDDGVQDIDEYLHVVSVTDLDANRVYLYINGSAVVPGGIGVGGTFDDWAGSDACGLGNTYGGDTGGSGGGFGNLSAYGGFEGEIARFAFYDHALTQEDALYLYTTTVALPEPTTLALVAIGAGLLRRRRRA